MNIRAPRPYDYAITPSDDNSRGVEIVNYVKRLLDEQTSRPGFRYPLSVPRTRSGWSALDLAIAAKVLREAGWEVHELIGDVAMTIQPAKTK